jgi:apolipoprotein N-acyltransferase
MAIDMGGTSGSLGTQEERTVFFDATHKVMIAPIICYESIFGEFVSEYVKNGASLIFIITNDGWWKDTPGYKQHFSYGRMRAIETRRCIARSANTGISCFINQRGDILQPTEWWKDAVIKGSLQINTEETFYVKLGDVIGRTSFYLSILLVVLSLIALPLMKKR